MKIGGSIDICYLKAADILFQQKPFHARLYDGWQLPMLRAKDPKVRRAWVCITAAGLVLQGIAGSERWPLDALV